MTISQQQVERLQAAFDFDHVLNQTPEYMRVTVYLKRGELYTRGRHKVTREMIHLKVPPHIYQNPLVTNAN